MTTSIKRTREEKGKLDKQMHKLRVQVVTSGKTTHDMVAIIFLVCQSTPYY